MKKNYIVYLFALTIPFLLIACNKDEDTEKQWKAENQRAYDKVVLGTDTIEWKELVNTPPGAENGVFYHVVEKGVGKENPVQTAYVKVLYTGYYSNGNIFDYGTSGTNYLTVTELPKEGDSDVVYILWNGDKYTTYIWLDGRKEYQEENFSVGASFAVNGVVRGFSIALQNMVVGDKWKICIPYHLGYGASGYRQNGITLIRGYSTLFFDVELLEINQYPGS